MSTDMGSTIKRRDFWSKEWPVWTAIVVAVVARLTLAPFAEHPYDMSVNKTWLRSALAYGVAGSFHTQIEENLLPNHGPLEIGLYALSGQGYPLISPELSVVDPWLGFFTKLPAIIFDVAAALAVLAMCKMFTTEKRARLWALAVLAHPAAIYLSSLWGQTDVVYSALLFASIACLAARRPGFAGALFAASMLHKPNALLFIPVIGLLTLRDLKTFIRFTMTWALVMLATHGYFLLSGSTWTYLDLFASSTDRASSGFGNALNFWRAVFSDGMWSRPARDACIGSLSCYHIGWGAVCALSLPFLWIAWSWRGAAIERWSIVYGAAASVSLAVYLFATGMHERYLFPYVLLAIPFAQRGWLHATAYWSVSMLYLISIMDHWRPVSWFDPAWSTLLADTSARLLVAFGLLHMGLVIRDAWNERKTPKKPAPKKPAKKKKATR